MTSIMRSIIPVSRRRGPDCIVFKDVLRAEAAEAATER